MSKRSCPTPGCPNLTRGGPCTACARERDKARGTQAQRGYGADHIKLKADWQRRLDAGETPMCGRDCGHPVVAGQSWALDHTDDRTAYLGPSHTLCNLQAAGRARHTT